MATVGFTAVALLFTVVAAAVHFATYGPESWAPFLSSAGLAMFAMVFVLFGTVIVLVSLGRLPFEAMLGDLPLPAKVAGVLGTVYVAINFVVAFKALSPSRVQDPMLMARLFTGHVLFFSGFATAMGYEIDRIRRGKLNPNRAPRDQALEERPLPAPLARSATLQTMLSPSECAARLLAPSPARPISLVGGYGLRGEADAEGFRLELGGNRSSMVYAVGRFEGSRPTFIRLLLTFKRWVLLMFAVIVLLLPPWALFLSGSGYPFGWEGVVFVVLIGGGGNFLFALAQMRSLQKQIEERTEAQPVSIG